MCVHTETLAKTNEATGPLRSRRPCGWEVADQSAVWAETRVSSHVLLGVDAAVGGQLVRL